MNSNSENPGVGKAFQGKEHMIMERYHVFLNIVFL